MASTESVPLTDEYPSPPAAARILAGAAESVLLLAVLAAPWPFGAAEDVYRYALAAVLFGACTLWALSRGLRGRGLPPLAPFAVAPIAWAALQAITGWSAAPIRTAEATLLGLAWAGVLVFWSDRARERGAATRLAMAVIVVCVAQAIFATAQWSLSPGRVYGWQTPIVTMPFGSYVNHNHFAGLIEMGTLLAVGLAFGHARRASTLTPFSLVLFGAGLGLAATQLASRSRGGLVALFGGLAALAVLIARSRGGGNRKRVAIAVVSIIAVLTFGLLAVPRDTRRHLASVVRGPSDPSGNYRLDTAVATLRLALAHPLVGCGFGAYPDAVPALKLSHGEVRTTHAESDVLELLAEGGLVGFGLVLALGVAISRALGNRLQVGRDPFRQGIALGAAGAVAAIGVHSFLDFNLRIPANAVIAFSLLGLTGAAYSEERSWGSRRTAFLAAVIALLLATAAAWRAAGAEAFNGAVTRHGSQLKALALDGVLARHPYLAEGYRARARALWEMARRTAVARDLRLGQAESDLRRAVRLRPNWGEAWAELGWIRFVRGDRAEASQALERSAVLDPTHPQVILTYADFLGRTGRVEEAVAALRRVHGVGLERRLSLATAWTQDRALLLRLTSGGLEGEAAVDRALRRP